MLPSTSLVVNIVVVFDLLLGVCLRALLCIRNHALFSFLVSQLYTDVHHTRMTPPTSRRILGHDLHVRNDAR